MTLLSNAKKLSHVRTKPKNNPRPVGKTAVANHVGSGVLLGGKTVTVRIGVDAAELMAISKELPNLLESLSKFGDRIRLRLLDQLIEPGAQVGVCRGKTALRAGDNIIRLRASRSLKVTVAALRTLNVFGAHKILDANLPPNEKVQTPRKEKL